MTAVLAIDQGTTGSTALVVGADGRLLGRGYREIPQFFPAPGEVEHDLEEILQATVAAAREALAQAHVVPAALGVTNQRETVCVWARGTPRPGLAGPAYGAALPRPGSGPPWDHDPRAHGTGARSVFLRDQDRVAARARARSRPPGALGRGRVRHHRRVAAVPAHERAGVPDRPHQRVPDDALQHH